MNVESASPSAVIWVYVVVMGLAAGGWLPTMSMLVSTNFGLAAYGAIFGAMFLAESTGEATGPLVAGYMYDIMGNYQQAFIVLLVSNAIAVTAALAVRRPKSLQDLKGEMTGSG